LPRMQCTRDIPVDWLNSGLCPDRPKGWIPIIIKNAVKLRCCLPHICWLPYKFL